jgi:hypothetical protein
MKIAIAIAANILTVIVAMIPTWLFFFIRHLAEPQGFWQNLILFGLGFYFLVGIQIICAVFALVVIVGTWAVALD